MISIVSPVYRGEYILETLVSEIELAMANIGEPYEIILVDDRSPDNSWAKMKQLKETRPHVKIFRLSKNFGQHPTIFAGLTQATGDWIVVMDCDMQDHPREIINLYHEAKKGYDVVLARRKDRQHSTIKYAFSRFYYRTFKYLADIDVDKEIGNFGIYSSKAIKAALNMGDYIKFFPLFMNWVGFNKTCIEVQHEKRFEGKSSYNIQKLLSLAFNTILSFSDKPLKIAIVAGAVISLLTFIISCFYVIRYFFGDITQPGFITIILSVWFFSGLIISLLGIVGLYISKSFNQVKNRPAFIIDEYEY